MYSFKFSGQFLSKPEQDIFQDHLEFLGLEANAWEVFESLFQSGTRHTKPLLLRAYQNDELAGAAIIIKCSHYGKALFNNRAVSSLIDSLKVPFYLWIRFGCCMDMMSNPGFSRYPEKHDEVSKAMLQFLRKKNLLTIINDYTSHSDLFENAAVLPALPHALIECSSMDSLEDYLSSFKNIRRKLKTFSKKGGKYIRKPIRLDEDEVTSLRKCFVSTTESSVFYLPYQDLYLSSAVNTSRAEIDGVHYFIASLEGEFLGYQAAIKSGRHLNALHGAFDRNRKTTHHAYDILFVKMTEFAIENGLDSIDFGAVLNYTKQKMVNKTLGMSYYIYSKYDFVMKLAGPLLRSTKIQGDEQLKFLE